MSAVPPALIRAAAPRVLLSCPCLSLLGSDHGSRTLVPNLSALCSVAHSGLLQVPSRPVFVRFSLRRAVPFAPRGLSFDTSLPFDARAGARASHPARACTPSVRRTPARAAPTTLGSPDSRSPSFLLPWLTGSARRRPANIPRLRTSRCCSTCTLRARRRTRRTRRRRRLRSRPALPLLRCRAAAPDPRAGGDR